MSRTTNVTALLRRSLLVAITVLVAALAMSAAKPSTAHALVDPSIVREGFVGWGYVRSDHKPRACPAIYPAPAWCFNQPVDYKTAYQWTGRAWRATSIAGGTQVYIYPYSGAWSWIWTQRTGWLAIERSNLSTGRTCPVNAYC